MQSVKLRRAQLLCMASDDEYDYGRAGRPRGVLSPADREYLLGESDLEDQSHGERRRRGFIRERLLHAILDFRLIFEYLEQRDIVQVFDPVRDPGRDADKSRDREKEDALRAGVEDVFAFLYGATRRSHPSFRHLVQTGVRRGAKRYFGRNDRATVEIEQPDRGRIEEIQRTIDAGRPDALTDAERDRVIDVLVEAGELPDVREAWEQTGDGQMLADLESDLDEKEE